LIKQAIQHNGYAIIDIFHPCITFNKLNTFAWYKAHTYWLDEARPKEDRGEAMRLALDEEKLACGILYQTQGQSYVQRHPFYQGDMTPFYLRERDLKKVEELL
jgi:2-oxoglutarate ferredoxin oxidoreductase subunit beta